jgi:hypothetical protein
MDLEELINQVDEALARDHDEVQAEAAELQNTVSGLMDGLQRVQGFST